MKQEWSDYLLVVLRAFCFSTALRWHKRDVYMVTHFSYFPLFFLFVLTINYLSKISGICWVFSIFPLKRFLIVPSNKDYAQLDWWCGFHYIFIIFSYSAGMLWSGSKLFFDKWRSLLILRTDVIDFSPSLSCSLRSADHSDNKETYGSRRPTSSSCECTWKTIIQ